MLFRSSVESPPDREVEMGISDEYAKQMINKSEAYDDIEPGPRLKNFEQVYGEIIARDLKRKSEEGEDGYPDEEDVPEASAAEQYEYIDEKYRSQTLTGDEDENKCEEDISEIFSNEVNTEKLEEMDDVEIPPLKVPRDELYRMDMPSLSGKKNGDKGAEIDLIVLAGFLVIIPEEMVAKYRNRIIKPLSNFQRKRR